MKTVEIILKGESPFHSYQLSLICDMPTSGEQSSAGGEKNWAQELLRQDQHRAD